MNTCPICEKTVNLGPYDICGVCGWENDLYQLAHPEADGHANKVSLNEAKQMWSIGESFDRNFPHPDKING